MHKLGKKDSVMCSADLESQLITGCLSWDNSTESHVQQSSLSKSLSLKMGVPARHCHNIKQLTFQFHDQDSSSTQSTGQSHTEVTSMKESNLYGHSMISSHLEKQANLLKEQADQAASSMGAQGFVFPSQLDYSQAIARIPFQYAEPYFGGLLAAPYGHQAIIHNPQMIGMASARVPLPVNLEEHEPIYVNAKQFRAILRRRQYRAKLEAQNKHVKNRKPYLHESRHLHALRRARGSGGRFLNTKEQQSKPTLSSHGLEISGTTQLHLSGDVSESEVHQPEIYRDGSSTTCCSEVTSASNSDNIFQQQPEFRFSGYPVHIGGSIPTRLTGMHGNGSHNLLTLQ